ncbi:hypothetical protein ACQEVC_45345 [Plantactinospora sp. CA-294935]|uniref:hypothetical protein n=1 Tax=Plantactinospora sp. CA-294935 TaxID=3240012 RepID=UPI003D8D2818
MNLLRVVADDLRHARQVWDGYGHLIRRYAEYRDTHSDLIAGLRADRIADETDLLLWHLDRSRLARVCARHSVTRLRETSAYWRFQARRWYACAGQEEGP